jgi:hypothetical protein
MVGDLASAMQQDATEAASALLQQVSALFEEPERPQRERNGQRFPINFSMRLMPSCRKGKLLHFEPMEIVGRDLSPAGIRFSHSCTIPHKQVIIYLFHPKITRFAVEAEILWTRSKSPDDFESGCRLIRKLASDELVAMF